MVIWVFFFCSQVLIQFFNKVFNTICLIIYQREKEDECLHLLFHFSHACNKGLISKKGTRKPFKLGYKNQIFSATVTTSYGLCQQETKVSSGSWVQNTTNLDVGHSCSKQSLNHQATCLHPLLFLNAQQSSPTTVDTFSSGQVHRMNFRVWFSLHSENVLFTKSCHLPSRYIHDY